MQLPNGEKAILAYFHHSSQALKAMSELKDAGFSEIQMDRITKPPITHEDTNGFRNSSLYEYAHELTGEIDADTAGSYSSSLVADLHDEHDYIVTIVSDRPSANHALSIVKKYAHIVN